MSLYLVFILIKELGIHSKDLPLVPCALLLFSYGKERALQNGLQTKTREVYTAHQSQKKNKVWAPSGQTQTQTQTQSYNKPKKAKISIPDWTAEACEQSFDSWTINFNHSTHQKLCLLLPNNPEQKKKFILQPFWSNLLLSKPYWTGADMGVISSKYETHLMLIWGMEKFVTQHSKSCLAGTSTKPNSIGICTKYQHWFIATWKCVLHIKLGDSIKTNFQTKGFKAKVGEYNSSKMRMSVFFICVWQHRST